MSLLIAFNKHVLFVFLAFDIHSMNWLHTARTCFTKTNIHPKKDLQRYLKVEERKREINMIKSEKIHEIWLWIGYNSIENATVWTYDARINAILLSLNLLKVEFYRFSYVVWEIPKSQIVRGFQTQKSS